MTHIEQRADTAAAWTAANPVLYPNEMGWETDTGKAKIGNGVTAWSALPYFYAGPQTRISLGLGNVDNTSDANKPVSTATQAALDFKAPLASPVFTGDPKAPTPATADNDTSIATTAFVNAAMAATTQFARYASVSGAGGDLNSLTTAGMYKVTSGSNFPLGFTSGYLTVAGDATLCGQIFTSPDGLRLFYRAYNSGWQPWREITGHVLAHFATVTNDTLSGLAARDGYTPVAGDIALVTAQTASAANGIYVASSGSWARATWADTSAEIAALLGVRVLNGMVNANTRWTTTFKASDTLGTTAMRWISSAAASVEGVNFQRGSSSITMTSGASGAESQVTVSLDAAIFNGASPTYVFVQSYGAFGSWVSVNVESRAANAFTAVMKNLHSAAFTNGTAIGFHWTAHK